MLHRTLLAALAVVLSAGCRDPAELNPLRSPDAAAPDASPPACPPCVTDSDCASGSICAQFSGDTFCAVSCGSTNCPADHSCATLTSATGAQILVCIPVADLCGPNDQPDSGPAVPDAGIADPNVCGPLVGPPVAACCHSCPQGSSCAPNGCFGGWFCNTQGCHCQRPPASATCGAAGADAGPRRDAGPKPDAGPRPDGAIDGTGGKLPELRFAIVGDTRPANIEDTPGYPTEIVTQIWQAVQDEAPPFTVTTGDYMFARPNFDQSWAQLDLYLDARGWYTGLLYPAFGNHECTGATASNCGLTNPDGITQNYLAYQAKLLAPIGQTSPYYGVDFTAEDGSWTAKFLFVAANAWSADQAAWLEAQLSRPTMYTFVVRHEGSRAPQAPGVMPSGAIMARHPYTLLLAGHSHTFQYNSRDREVITGNGGAPLTGSVNYGYVIVVRRPDGALQFSAHDYASRAVFSTFAVTKDGTPAP